MEIVSIGSVIYFITYINKTSLDSSLNKLDGLIVKTSSFFEFDPIIFLGLVVIIFLLLSNLLIIFNHFLSTYLSSKITSEISENLMNYYLRRNYLSHVNDESSRIVNNLSSIAWRIGYEILDSNELIV